MNEIVSQLIQTIQQGYIHDPNRILQDYHKEIKEIEGYRGRELLELLQNAVDELNDDKEKCICIELNDNILSISNNGNYFTQDGVKSLMYSDLSPKYNNTKYIGNKGTGFRSILNWAKNVSIYSGDLSIAFNKSNAENLLLELLNHDNVKRFKEQNPDLQVATLVVPRIIDPLPDMCFDTVIKIELEASDEVLSSAKKQIAQVDMELLLFLARLDKLIIVMDGSITMFTKTRTKGSFSNTNIEYVTIEQTIDGILCDKKTWNLNSVSGDYEGKRYEICVAYTEELDTVSDVIYSFFKTEIEFPLPMLVHGTFDLTADRNGLIKNKTNKFVLSKLCDLIIQAAKDISRLSVDYAPLKLLALIKEFPKGLEWFGFQEHYINAVAESAVLPTVNGKYISFLDSPKYYINNLADYLYGADFEELLLYTEDDHIQNFISRVADKKQVDLEYSYSEITKAIDKIINQLTLEKRAYCAVAFLKEYKDFIQNDHPHFLIDMEGHVVGDNQIVYLQPDAQLNDFSQPPKFTKILYLHAEMRIKFSEALGLNRARDIALQLEKYGIKEYNLTTIIQSIYTRLSKKKHPDSRSTVNCCEQAVKWLWKNREAVKELNTSQLDFFLVARDGKIRSAKKLYWGKEYDNDICDDLFIGNNALFVCKPQKYGINGDYISEFKEMFSSFGVACTPRIQLKEIKLSDEYKKIVEKNFGFPLKAEDNYYKTREAYDKASVSIRNTAQIRTIEHFDLIIDKASTKAIIQWLMNDEVILTAAQQESIQSSVWLMEPRQQVPRKIPSSAVFSYIRFRLYTSKWVEVNGIRYAPKQCVLFSKVGDKLLPVVIAPNLNDYVTSENKRNKELLEVRDVFIKIGMAQDFSELSVSTFYEILLMLPGIDEKGELSKALYTSIIESQGFDESNYQKNEFYRQYMQTGEVFCKNHKCFAPINNTFYLTEKTVCEKILNNYNLIAIPHRQSMSTIEHWLGIKPLHIKGHVVGSPVLHNLNRDFSADFNDFKLAAFCYRIIAAKPPEKSMFKSLEVRLCSKVKVDYSKEVTELNDYEFITERTNLVYLKIPEGFTNISDLKKEVFFCGAIASILTSACDIQDKTLFANFRNIYSQSSKSRREIITQDFDDIDVLIDAKNILNYTQSKIEEFTSILTQFIGVQLSPELLSLISSINFDEIDCVNNGKIIIDIFNQLHISIDEFNRLSEITVDLRPYYIYLLEKLKEDNFLKLKCHKYNELIGKTIEQKELFNKEIRSYQSYVFDPENKIDFDYTRYFEILFFGGKEEIIFDIDEQYKRHHSIFADNKDAEIVMEFLALDANDSLIYFGEIENLTSKYETYLLDLEKQFENERKIRLRETHIVLEIQDILTTAQSGQPPKTNKPGAAHSKLGQTKARANETWGHYGERLVYYSLVQQYGKNVTWVSENARKDNINPNGTAGLGYDITYINSNNDKIFVEVKSTKDKKISFPISENELLIGELNPDNYEVFVVNEVETEPKIFRLSGLFKYTEFESRENNKRFRLMTEHNYIINCEINS